jgi:formate hydrogenlyase subunit 3/multisubunit Na+/H+ antiporter MnhD subunit
MSLSSWALVMAHHRVSGITGYVYLIVANFGTLMLLLASACSPALTAFMALRRSACLGEVAALVLILALIGRLEGRRCRFVWLPLSTGGADHVSALMGGVMTKVAVYGFVRIVAICSASRCGGGASSCLRSPG